MNSLIINTRGLVLQAGCVHLLSLSVRSLSEWSHGECLLLHPLQEMEVRWGRDPDLQRLLAERKAMEDGGERMQAIDEAIRLRLPAGRCPCARCSTNNSNYTT
eukprot:3296986-Amphidinium_carterae.1